jgi:RNA-directed DNA polymerase
MTGVLLVKGERVDAEAMREEATAVLATAGLRLSHGKTLITHIDQGPDFLGWRIQRHRKPGTAKSYVYTCPSKKAVKAVTGKVRALSRLNRNQPLEVLLHNLNPVLRGWCTYFQPGVSSATCAYLRGFTWRRVMGWLRRKHPRMSWKQPRRRYCHGSLVAVRQRRGAVQPGADAHDPLPLPGRGNPAPSASMT